MHVGKLDSGTFTKRGRYESFLLNINEVGGDEYYFIHTSGNS